MGNLISNKRLFGILELLWLAVRSGRDTEQSLVASGAR